MTESKNREKPHEFAALPEFDRAVRKIMQTPKEAVEHAAKKQQRERKRKRK